MNIAGAKVLVTGDAVARNAQTITPAAGVEPVALDTSRCRASAAPRPSVRRPSPNGPALAPQRSG